MLVKAVSPLIWWQRRGTPPQIKANAPSLHAKNEFAVTLFGTASTLRTHIVLTFLFIEFTLFFCGGILVLLVLGNKIVHVRLCFGELHLVHTFSCVPVQKSF